MQDFRKLMVWNKAHALTLDVYAITKPFPSAERFGLTAQLRRSASSVATNLAEGCGRGSVPSFASFVQVAFGSACECEYQCLLALDLGYIGPTDHEVLAAQVTEVKRMLASLLRTLSIKAAVRGKG
ncbi:MAG: four helix bundle protein [Gemmatimonadaceae bacterium]|nr:four helix bundle protein [Gemmatimonadaceae bacterium]